MSDSNYTSLDDDILNVSMNLLKNDIIPSIDNVSKHSKYNFKLINTRFSTDNELIIFIISSFDLLIKDKILLNLKVNENIISFFVDECLPIIIKYKNILGPLYKNDYTRRIIVQYLIDFYSNLLIRHFEVKSLLKARLITINIIELINASLTYSSDSDINSCSEDIKIFF